MPEHVKEEPYSNYQGPYIRCSAPKSQTQTPNPINPKPQTLNPKRLNPKPQTPKPPKARNPFFGVQPQPLPESPIYPLSKELDLKI